MSRGRTTRLYPFRLRAENPTLRMSNPSHPRNRTAMRHSECDDVWCHVAVRVGRDPIPTGRRCGELWPLMAAAAIGLAFQLVGASRTSIAAVRHEPGPD